VLMPTDILRPFGLVHLIPILLTIHLVSSTPLRAGHFTSNQWSLELFAFSTIRILMPELIFSLGVNQRPKQRRLLYVQVTKLC
jgi:hypothetical protein